MRLKTSNFLIDHQSQCFLTTSKKSLKKSNPTLFAWFILNYEEEKIYIAFLNLKVFNDLIWKVCSSNISLAVHHLKLFICLMPDLPKVEQNATSHVSNWFHFYFRLYRPAHVYCSTSVLYLWYKRISTVQIHLQCNKDESSIGAV